HHPFDLPDRTGEVDLVGRAAPAMEVFARCGVDLLLAGHFHTSEAGATSARYRIPGYAALVVQAGTATSTRGRGEQNSFYVLHADELDDLRHLVGGHVVARPGDDVVGAGLAFRLGAQHDNGLHRLAAVGVAGGDDARLLHRRMLVEQHLDLGRPDLEAARVDH